MDFSWTGSVEPWKRAQEQVCSQVVVSPLPELPRYVAGVDCAFSRDGQYVKAAAVVFDRVERAIIEQQTHTMRCRAPYVPTFLTFREAPAILAVLEKVRHCFNALLFDGQGLAHPRRCGLATHMGVLLDLPSVGCAKSRLIGTFDDPKSLAGSYCRLMDNDEQIGVVLRTRDGVSPLFVSIGHRVDLDSAIRLTLACCTRYRLPEPTRIADKLSKFR